MKKYFGVFVWNRRYCFGSSAKGEPILSFRKVTICFQRPCILGQDYMWWKNVPVSRPHIGHVVD